MSVRRGLIASDLLLQNYSLEVPVTWCLVPERSGTMELEVLHWRKFNCVTTNFFCITRPSISPKQTGRTNSRLGLTGFEPSDRLLIWQGIWSQRIWHRPPVKRKICAKTQNEDENQRLDCWCVTSLFLLNLFFLHGDLWCWAELRSVHILSFEVFSLS